MPVLLAHTLDDQAETVLLGLGRGSGARSIAGMRVADPPWYRPLLGLRRSQTHAACAELGIAAWDDPHNHDRRFTRVRLRREVLPLLEDVLGGGVAEALARTATALREDTEALDAISEHSLAAARVGGAQRRGAGAAARRGAPPGHPRLAAHRGASGLSDKQIRAVDALVTAWRARAARPSAPISGTDGCSPRAATARWCSTPKPCNWSPGPAHGTLWACRSTTCIPGHQIGPAVPRPDPGAHGRTGRTGRPRLRRQPGRPGPVAGHRPQGRGDVRDRPGPALPVPTQLEFMAVSSYGSATSSSGWCAF